MKAKIYTLIVLIAMTASTMLAGSLKNLNIKTETVKNEITIDLLKLAPSTPGEAAFMDGTEMIAMPAVLVSQIAPVTPREADFEDPSGIEANTDCISGTPDKLAPVTPVEADFMD